MPDVTYFDHTADVGMRVEADSLDEVFHAMARGLFAYVVTNPQAVEPREQESVEIESGDLSQLLAAWLNELIFRSETRHRLYSRFDVEVDLATASLRGTIHGEAIDPDRHELDHEVKAATHHGLRCEPSGSGWVAQVILDI